MAQTILVVDDEPQIVKVLRGYLEQAGFRVVTANDGQLALTQYKHEKPDLRANAVDGLRSILLNPQRIARILGNLTGLAIARQLVEAHGRRIWAASEPGKGTTVSFALPLTRS